MAYGLPILTLRKSEEILQSVEYGYINSGSNGFIGQDLVEIRKFITETSDEKIKEIGDYARTYVLENLLMDSMVERFINGILHTSETELDYQ